MRTEAEIFNDLANLCKSPGYIHAIADLCYKRFTQSKTDGIQTQDYDYLYSNNKRIRSEILVLIGLLLRHRHITYEIVSQEILTRDIEKTENLLTELHKCIEEFSKQQIDEFFKPPKPLNEIGDTLGGELYRGLFFYGSQSAYSFQYSDLMHQKYISDDHWIKKNKGFSICDVKVIADAIKDIQDNKMTELVRQQIQPPELLTGFIITKNEIIKKTHIAEEIVQKVFESFSCDPNGGNDKFCSIDQTNIAEQRPLIRKEKDSYLLLDQFSMYESMYESPFYWLYEDGEYKQTASSNRGKFTEQICSKFLSATFKEGTLYSNVKIKKSRGRTLGEIDILVVFGTCAIVVESKSKRLRFEARGGDHGILDEDFNLAIQKAYDQAFKCSEFLISNNSYLEDSNGTRINLTNELKAVYIICAFCDRYPGLAFQTYTRLTRRYHHSISLPIVTDIFTIDTITELLESPLRVINYFDQRTKYFCSLLADHEVAIFGYHLKHNNLSDASPVGDHHAQEVEKVMTIRRTGQRGCRTPDGILTKFRNTFFERIINTIQYSKDPVEFDLGCKLLALRIGFVKQLNQQINSYSQSENAGNYLPIYTVNINKDQTGFTIFFSSDISIKNRLLNYCTNQKDAHKANSWFGLLVSPENLAITYAVVFNASEPPSILDNALIL